MIARRNITYLASLGKFKLSNQHCKCAFHLKHREVVSNTRSRACIMGIGTELNQK
jgi:hypothetical protein